MAWTEPEVLYWCWIVEEGMPFDAQEHIFQENQAGRLQQHMILLVEQHRDKISMLVKQFLQQKQQLLRGTVFVCLFVWLSALHFALPISCTRLCLTILQRPLCFKDCKHNARMKYHR